MTEVVAAASSPAAYDAFGALIREYVEWCRARYADNTWMVVLAFGVNKHSRAGDRVCRSARESSPRAA